MQTEKPNNEAEIEKRAQPELGPEEVEIEPAAAMRDEDDFSFDEQPEGSEEYPFEMDPEVTSPAAVKEEPSFTLNDFDEALQDDGPQPDSPPAEIAAAVRRWHGILTSVGRKKTVLAWRIGQALTRIRLQIKNGEWYSFLDREFSGISKTTLWRYTQLYERSPKIPPKRALTDAYIDLGIANAGRNTVEDYLQAEQGMVTKLTGLTRVIASIVKQRSRLMDHIDYHDFADIDGETLLTHEAGLNMAFRKLIEVIDANPADNLFSRFSEDIGKRARLAAVNGVARSLRSPYDEHGGEGIPDECIPETLLDPGIVKRWADERRSAADRESEYRKHKQAEYGLSRMEKNANRYDF